MERGDLRLYLSDIISDGEQLMLYHQVHSPIKYMLNNYYKLFILFKFKRLVPICFVIIQMNFAVIFFVVFVILHHYSFPGR